MQRIKSIDLARGFTVLFIPIVHSVMVYGDPATHESAIVTVLAFVAEWPGAQVFMLLMGVSFALTEQRNFKKTLMRSIILLIAGYLLNALKFFLPYFLGVFPEQFLTDLNANGWSSLLLTGDIFHFAALSLIILYAVKRLPEYPVFAILLAVMICFASPYWWDLQSSNPIAGHLLGLMTGQPPKVFFPLLPWIVYPLAGLAIGYFFKRCLISSYIGLFFLGLGLFFIASSIYLSSDHLSGSFYRTTSWDTLRHLGFVFTWLSLWWMATELFPDNFLFRFLVWGSKNITLIYVLQWPIIFWLMPVIGYHTLNVHESLIVGLCISGFIFLLCSFVLKQKNQKFKEKRMAPPVFPAHAHEDSESL